MMTFVSRGGRAYRGIEALRDRRLRTCELAAVMGISPRRVHAYMRWALDAEAVVMVERGLPGGVGSGRETVWGIGPTPTQLGTDQPVKRATRAKVRPASSIWDHAARFAA